VGIKRTLKTQEITFMYKKQPIEGDFNKKRTLKTQEITFMIKMITDP